jgi:hypothetical protein
MIARGVLAMKRRNFLRSIPAAIALAPRGTSAFASASESPAGASVCYVSPGSINGSAARVLMPPKETPPLPQSGRFKGISFTGRQRNYLPTVAADTWYPSWAADGTLYSSWADGRVLDSSGQEIRVNCQWKAPEGWFRDLGMSVSQGRITSDLDKSTTTGNAILTGDDPFDLKIVALGSFRHESLRYEGYYPCANLFHRGIWYYGGYRCHRWLNSHDVPITYELGGFGGFRMSSDRGKTWQDTPLDDRRPLFPETGRCSGGAPIKLGTPHFVDLGRELEHSRDGYAYLVGHGTYDPDGISNWSSGDAISITRVRPSPGTINDPGAYEFFAGHDSAGRPEWSKDFSRITPIIKWPGGSGCVNVTYHPVLKRYFGFICVGWADGDSGSYDTWFVESDELTGPWHSIACLRGMGGGQPYFVCMPSKFIQPDSRKITLFYSANWRKQRPGIESWVNPQGPPGIYSLCVAEFELQEGT